MTCADLDHLWTAFTALGTVVLAAVAIVAYFAALGQLDAAKRAREDAVRIAKAERTAELLAAFGTEDMEFTFGFFDAAADVAESREVFNELYQSLVVASSQEFRAKPREQRMAQLRHEAIEYLDEQRGHDAPSLASRDDRATACKNEIVTVANLCERAWVLLHNDVIDGKTFLDDQGYDIASTYFIVQDALADLCKEEHFNFDDFRSLALMARDSLRASPLGKDLANEQFPPLPDYAPTGISSD